MFAPPPPDVEAHPPAIAAEQQADFDCLRIATVLGKPAGDGGVSPWGARLFRAYLHRLEHADPNRDWVATARAVGPPMSYGWFLQTLETCTTPLRSRTIVRPTQAAPPAAPQPTGS
ncbi:hypothetical protein [Phenylobacterium sp.]|jgi:hypothetical protein|uniref:hypothetical protein n=1 Tax=Phenylobacterium sp. TaxID=1871053 RepID=UPI002E33AFD9|nr:hypothetical protein [Phenylobacterium sp.]HEX3365964.1 hypothetical protein [Phenylobacterium sp.]